MLTWFYTLLKDSTERQTELFTEVLRVSANVRAEEQLHSPELQQGLGQCPSILSKSEYEVGINCKIFL